MPPSQRSTPSAQSVQRAGAGAMGGLAGAAAQESFAAGQMRPPGEQTLRNKATHDPAQATQARERAPEGSWTGPRPLPPEARAAGAAGAASAPNADAHARTATPPPPESPDPATDIPDWLSERLREDAEEDAQRQRSRLLTRRALGWSAAATLVAMLAVAGHWFYQESRLEGALNVVANTSPVAPPLSRAPAAQPPAGAVRPTALPAAPAAAAPLVETPVAAAPAVPDRPAVTPPATVDRGAAPTTMDPAASTVPNAMPASAQSAPSTAAADASARDVSTPERTQHASGKAGASPDNTVHPRHASAAATHRKRHSPAETHPRATVDSGPTPAQRREETLMQCRALGYDARECARRGCMMTRFGLACPG